MLVFLRTHLIHISNVRCHWWKISEENRELITTWTTVRPRLWCHCSVYMFTINFLSMENIAWLQCIRNTLNRRTFAILYTQLGRVSYRNPENDFKWNASGLHWNAIFGMHHDLSSFHRWKLDLRIYHQRSRPLPCPKNYLKSGLRRYIFNFDDY